VELNSNKINDMDPLTYIDEIYKKKHIILVYDDIKKGREIEYYFIKGGLENNEKCIYLTHDDPIQIENDMQKFGIDVARSKRKSRLCVYPMTNFISDSTNILDNMQNIMKLILGDQQTPFRIVGRAIQDIRFEEAISVELYLEKILHGQFDNLNGSILCTYDLTHIMSNNRWRDWLSKLESYHHASLITTYDKNLVKINIDA